MNKDNKHKIFKNEFNINCRCNRHINDLIKEYMRIQDCDRSTSVRDLLQIVLDMGGTDLIK